MSCTAHTPWSAFCSLSGGIHRVGLIGWDSKVQASMSRRRSQSGFTFIETMIVVAILGVISVIAIPMIANTLANFHLTGDSRAVSNNIALAKMRAASDFSRVRLYVDLGTKSHHIETLDKTQTPMHWTQEGGWTYLSQNVNFSFGVVTTPPPNTQAVIALAPPCTDDLGANIGNTACIMFNSRGIPIGVTGGPPADIYALYLTDGTAVYANVVAATGMIRTWRAAPVATPAWVTQ
jgi:prepilin-type N-terminal cleavage/methylation domain-containing protein